MVHQALATQKNINRLAFTLTAAAPAISFRMLDILSG
jgi:hypothetical protein